MQVSYLVAFLHDAIFREALTGASVLCREIQIV